MALTLSANVAAEIGRLLKEERTLRGLSLEDAAQRADLDPEHLREVEEGYPDTDSDSRRGPTLLKLERVANVYGLRVALVRY
jgi:transcriptional regulator with XRE-family HTH domain